jgi:glycosyltransferase involved in cell wall biosynthesis
VIVPSEFVKRELLERLRIPPEKVRVAPLGVGAEFEPASADAVQAICRRYGIAQPYLLCVGNLEPKKNLAATVRAFGLAKQTGGLPHQLVLAGGKSWGSVDIEREAAALPADTLRRIGYVAPEDLPALYSGAEALLFWSLVEGFGLPALEAMACGTPVVCSDRGALPEVVREAALVVPVGEAEALAAAIRRVTADGALRTQLVADGRRRAAEFTWRGHADAVLAAYAELDSGVR